MKSTGVFGIRVRALYMNMGMGLSDWVLLDLVLWQASTSSTTFELWEMRSIAGCDAYGYYINAVVNE